MKQLFSLPIRAHLLILSVIMMIGPIGIIIYSSLKQRTYQENVAKYHTQQLVNRVSSEISSFAASTELLLNTLSKISIVQQQNSQAVNHLLADIVKQNPVYSNLLMLDRTGNLWASALPFKAPVSYAERRHVKNALVTGMFSSSEYSMGKLIKKPIFAFALPMKDASGQITGVAIAALDLDNFKRMLEGLKFGEDTTILLVDHKGTILYNALRPELIGKEDRNDLFKRMTGNGNEGTFEAVGNIGTYRIISYHKLKLPHEQAPYMYVRAAIDHSKALEQANRDLLINIIVLTNIVLIMLGCAFYVSKKYLIEKIDTLQDASRRLAKGDLDVRVAAKVTGGELGELGRTFDTMAQALSEDRAARELTEKSLIDSEARLRNAVLGSPYPTMLSAEDGEVILISNSWTEITGYSHDDIPTITDWTRQAYGKDAENVQDEIRKLFNLTCRSDEGEYRIMTKDGNIRVWDFSTSPIGELPDGRRVVISLAKDVTEHKLLEEQLVQSQKMEAIGTLAGGVAHDFNNILTVIEGYGTMLYKHVKDDPKAQSMLNQVLVSSRRAAEMTSQLLAFSRKQTLELKTVQLNDVIHELQKSLSRLIGEHIDCRVDLPLNPLYANADRGQIEQVIINLAVNARDAMPHGGKLLISIQEIIIDDRTIGVHDIDTQGRYGLISVTDTGSGIAPEIQSRIFDPFFTTKEIGKGTGLGLSMVYGIIKKHNGFINVYSEVGKGTAFKVYLPLTDDVIGETPKNVSEELTRGTESILVAEDDTAILEMIRELLEDNGYTVYSASTGAEAIETFMAHQNVIDLILTDVIMPQGNGREVYEKISSIKPGIPVIYMSGYPADLLTKQGGMVDSYNYLSKPISPSTLLKKIREVICTPVQTK
jgi:PAS domain S-box-containing protein